MAKRPISPVHFWTINTLPHARARFVTKVRAPPSQVPHFADSTARLPTHKYSISRPPQE